ncbi:hypothetical protein ONZ45_g3636 [Pleurotus djamor]|nr:hypothetical protein ONZ45_g3636 [Pleurotus djamor]
MTPELEHTLSLLSAHRTVLGYILMSRGHPYSIIKQSGVIFDGEHGRKYAAAIGKIMENIQGALEELSEDSSDSDEVKFLRIRTKRHEVMISPNEAYLLAVLHDPAS